MRPAGQRHKEYEFVSKKDPFHRRTGAPHTTRRITALARNGIGTLLSKPNRCKVNRVRTGTTIRPRNPKFRRLKSGDICTGFGKNRAALFVLEKRGRIRCRKPISRKLLVLILVLKFDRRCYTTTSVDWAGRDLPRGAPKTLKTRIMSKSAVCRLWRLFGGPVSVRRGISMKIRNDGLPVFIGLLSNPIKTGRASLRIFIEIPLRTLTGPPNNLHSLQTADFDIILVFNVLGAPLGKSRPAQSTEVVV